MIKSVFNYRLSQLFDDNARVVYQIPRYQRPYTWNKKHWEDLFDDVLENDPGYFLGSIICINQTDDTMAIQQLELIDGQQRMTTLSILLASIYASLNQYAGQLLLARLETIEPGKIDHYFTHWNKLLGFLGDDNAIQERFFRHYYNGFRDELKEIIQVPVATRSNLIQIYEKLINHDVKECMKNLVAADKQYIWTIEHIFPQGENIPKAWVKMIADGDKDLAADHQRAHVHKLGNLTITGFNSLLGNKSFEEKRDRVDRKGRAVGFKNGLKLNQDLANADTWIVKQINARTKKLVEKAIESFSLEQ